MASHRSWRWLILLLTAVLLPGCGVAQEKRETGIVYEIFVGSFADSDGDGVGDLKGIESKLDYIASLGADSIWLTPIHPSPSYHHYDVMDYYAVAPEFGTLEDFDALAAACAEKGIGIILDLVVNHTSSEHPWFLSACDDLKAGRTDGLQDDFIFSQSSGQHPVPGTEDWYYEGAFGSHMPDLNLDCPGVRQEIASIIAFWQDHGVKGFRLDATTSYYTGNTARNTAFLQFITESAKAGDPDCYVVGEAWTNENTILEMYQSGIDSLFNFPASAAEGVIVKAASKGKGANVADKLAAWNEKIKAVSPAALDAPFLSNHDQARSRGMLGSNPKQMKAAAMLYLLLPGRPFVYYGEEIGMSGSGRDENKRLPMLWSGADETQNCLPPAEADQAQRLTDGVDAQEGDPDSLLNWYRQLGRIREMNPALIGGRMRAIETDNAALCAYTVASDGVSLAVLINTSLKENAEIDASAMGLAGYACLDALGADAEALNAGLRSGGASLPPIACAVLQGPESPILIAP
ncbi:MAG: alpha-amylase [Clostridia bacterium]|nr:alpha-amylase [Clostridia bacterium]